MKRKELLETVENIGHLAMLVEIDVAQPTFSDDVDSEARAHFAEILPTEREIEAILKAIKVTCSAVLTMAHGKFAMCAPDYLNSIIRIISKQLIEDRLYSTEDCSSIDFEVDADE